MRVKVQREYCQLGKVARNQERIVSAACGEAEPEAD